MSAAERPAEVATHVKPCILMYSVLLSATGGAQYTMSLLAEELARRGYRIVFVTRPPFDPSHRYARMLERASIPLVLLRRLTESAFIRLMTVAGAVLLFVPMLARRRRSVRDAWVAARSVAATAFARMEHWYIRRTLDAIVRRHRAGGRPTILHIFGPAALTPFLLGWARESGVPSIYHEMGEADEAYVRTFAMTETVASINRADRVVCLSPSVADTFREVFGYRGPIESIYAMVSDPGDAWVRGRKLGGRVTFGAIGRLVPHKQHNLLIRAIHALAAAGYDTGLVIAGSGPLRENLQRLAVDLGVADRVTFTGEFEDLAAVMAQFDVFVLPTSSESQCMPVTESMAYGKAVIVSRFGGIPDFVDDGVTGLLVPVGDFDGLVAAMKRLVDDAPLRAEMGARGRQRFLRDFSPAAVGDMTEQLYVNLLRSNEAGSVAGQSAA